MNLSKRNATHGAANVGFALLVMIVVSPLTQCPAALASDLNANQQKLLKDAKGFMVQLQANLKLANEAASGAQPSTAKAKLAMTRLGSVRQNAEEVKARLDQLPNDNPDVQSLSQQLNEAMQKIESLEASMTQGSLKDQPATSAPSPPSADRPASKSPAGVKLDYRQEEDLKNARFYIREVEALAGGAAQVAGEAKNATNVKALEIGRIKQGIDTIAKGKQRAALAQERLDKLPGESAEVADWSAQLSRHLSSLAESEKVLQPIYAQLSAAIDPGSHPNLAADTTRLRELGTMYSDTQVFVVDRPKAALLISEATAARKEHDRIVSIYADLIRQLTAEGRQLEGASRHFTERMSAFLAAAAVEKETLPAQIDADMQRAVKDADDAVARQNPAFFQGAVSQKLGFAEEKLLLYAALDPVNAPAVRTRFDEGKAQLAKRQEALRTSIIAANELPPDRYAGPDREQLIKIATDTWHKVEPGAKILAARFPGQQWMRETLWRQQSDSWYKIDRSKLQAQLIVAHDAKLAAIRPIDLWMDHLNGDRITASPIQTSKEDVRPQDLLPLEKVK